MFKSLFSMFVLVMLSLFTITLASATTLPKDTLIVERCVTAQNGSGSGKNISCYSFMVRKLSPTDCDTAVTAYNKQNTFSIGASNTTHDMGTKASCEAINYSIQY